MDSKEERKCTGPLTIDCCKMHHDCFESIKKNFRKDKGESFGGKLSMSDLLSTFIIHWCDDLR